MLVVFLLCLGTGGNALLTNKALLAKTQFPRECFPLEVMGVTGINTVLSWIPLAILFVIFGRAPAITTLWAPLFMVIEVAFAAGLTLAVSALIIQMRDLVQVLPVILSLGLFVNPVIWPLSKLSGPEVPKFVLPALLLLQPVGPGDRQRATHHAVGVGAGLVVDRDRHSWHAVLSRRRVSALQAAGGEFCRHCLTGQSKFENVWKGSGPTKPLHSSTTN